MTNSNEPKTCQPCGWREATGFSHILRTLAIASQPAKLGLAFAALVAMFAWGWALDMVWAPSGRIDPVAVQVFTASRLEGTPYVEPPGDYGPFGVFRRHERDAVVGFFGSIVPGLTYVGGLDDFAGRSFVGGPLEHLLQAREGVLWLAWTHPFFFLLFAAGALLIWSLCGGAICRLAALQFARDEKPTVRDGLNYSRRHCLGGFFLAPCVPLAFIALTLLVLALGGVFLRIPALGDIVGGLLFGLAILGGAFAALLLIGFLVGGHLFWPAVAVEGADAFDAFSRALAYTFTRPLKTLLYAILLILYAAVCWLLVRMFAFMALGLTKAAVGFGTSPFGWWSRGTGTAPVRKLDVLWPVTPGPHALWAAPDWSALSWYEYISAGLIALNVSIVDILVGAFLFSFYFSAATVAYFLLRRDVDMTDLDEISTEEDSPAPVPSPAPIPSPSVQPSPAAPSAPTPPPASPGTGPPAASPPTSGMA